MAVLAGRDFFTAEVLTWRGMATYYVLFVIHRKTRRVTFAGITRHPTEEWMEQVSRDLTDAEGGALLGQRYLLHDRDAKFCAGFRSILRDGDVEPPPADPARFPSSSSEVAQFWRVRVDLSSRAPKRKQAWFTRTLTKSSYVMVLCALGTPLVGMGRREASRLSRCDMTRSVKLDGTERHGEAEGHLKGLM